MFTGPVDWILAWAKPNYRHVLLLLFAFGHVLFLSCCAEHLEDILHWDAQYDRVFDAARGTYKLASPHTQLWRAVGQFDDLPTALPGWITSPR